MTKQDKKKKKKPAPACRICRYFITETKTLGQCRAEPPNIISASGKTDWPKVKTTDWCGCFKLAKQ